MKCYNSARENVATNIIVAKLLYSEKYTLVG